MATAGKPLPQTPPPLRDVATGEYDDGLSVFAPVRPRLFGIAYRMLGSAAEAEDVVQDVWLRWQSANRNAVENPPAYLATTTTRLCINLTQSAHTRRESYIGTWLPEPVDTSSDPGIGAERSEALKLAVLMLLEKLSSSERAAYVLREAFDYSYRQIADILQMEEANVRQLVSRARKHIADGRRTPVSSGAGSSSRSRARGEVHCHSCTFLEGRDARLDRDKWTGSRSSVARWRSRCDYDD